MKKIHTTLLITLISIFGYTQEVTLIPDVFFELELIMANIDSDMAINGQVLSSDIVNVTNLNIRNKNISDLTGIEGFENLIELNCVENFLTNLDVSKNIKLQRLWSSMNYISSLNIISNVNLEYFSFGGYQVGDEYYNFKKAKFNSIDISKNHKLKGLYFGDTEIMNLDLSLNPNLEILYIPRNKLTEIDVSNNPALTNLWCSGNSITTLDVSQNPKLKQLWSGHNDLLESLNIKNGNNNILLEALLNNCPLLTCIKVDDTSKANAYEGVYSLWTTDYTVTFSEDCSASLGADDQQLDNGLSLFPNPVTSTLYIESKELIIEISIFNTIGQKILQSEPPFKFIDLTGLSSGMYIFKIQSSKGVTTKKIIKL